MLKPRPGRPQRAEEGGARWDHAFCVSSTSRFHVTLNEPLSSWALKFVWEPR